MDLTIERYIHALHFPRAWPLFLAWHEEVNGCTTMQNLVNLTLEDGNILVLSELEKWAVLRQNCFKIGRNVQTDEVIGFIEYNLIADTGIKVESLYIRPELRYNGVSRAFISSFPGITQCTFKLHKSRREDPRSPMSQLLHSARKVCDDPTNPKFEIWEAQWNYKTEHKKATLLNIVYS